MIRVLICGLMAVMTAAAVMPMTKADESRWAYVVTAIVFVAALAASLWATA